MIVSYIKDDKSENISLKTLNDVLTFSETNAEYCEPSLEDQLADYNTEEKVIVEDVDPLQVSVFNKYDVKMTIVNVESFNDLCALIQKVKSDDVLEFQPFLLEQLKNKGGWNEEEIHKFYNFITEVQKSLPRDYRLAKMEQKITEYIKYWNNISSLDEIRVDTILEQFVELQTIVFK